MKVLITGADGYIAQGVIRHLLEKGNEVIGWGLTKSGIVHEAYSEMIGDIFESHASLEALAPDVLVHLAWRDGFDHYSATHVEDLPRHYDFLKSTIEVGISRIVVMGTMHEVGYHEGAIDEYTPCNPTTPYGVAKNALRQLCFGLAEKNSSDINIQWLRGFYLVDSSGCGNSIFSKIIRANQRGDALFPFTTGKNQYDFLSYQAFCEQVCAVVACPSKRGIINICSGKPVSLGEEIEDFIRENNLSIRLDYGAYPDRSYDSPAVWGDASRIQSIMSDRNRGMASC